MLFGGGRESTTDQMFSHKSWELFSQLSLGSLAGIVSQENLVVSDRFCYIIDITLGYEQHMHSFQCDNYTTRINESEGAWFPSHSGHQHQ